MSISRELSVSHGNEDKVNAGDVTDENLSRSVIFASVLEVMACHSANRD